MEVQRQMNESFLPTARSLNNYAGIYIDNHDGGRIVVQVTRDPEAARRELLAAEPSLAGEFDVRVVQFTETELAEAAGKLLAEQAHYLAGIEVYAVDVNTETNSIIAYVPAALARVARERVPALEEQLGGVPVSIEVGTPDVEAACTGREYCTSPGLS